ncbi:RNA polymerase II C-terminal domain phosphatase-like 1 isoform X3 [Carex littledalei]|uniref:RNA polymerase II C-terminal domain phosphatase-like 1 isoform X3 n=1 Tax=Carex littledalei TaxID=544730 RepID=A0A833QFQ2_9POAL|nr:RNA polymerase II C-terminal domain phosphatase-like 1 isoform X3 [Carex littledalei]
MFISYVYLKSGSSPIGEVEVYPKVANSISSQREFKIAYFTTFHNKQCSPLGALQTVGSGCLCFKMVCKNEAAKLVSIYTTCLREKQTAVIQEEHDEIHLVAMKSRKDPSTTRACFWGFKVSRSLFSTCLDMLKQRRLGIVFGLDETLIITNTTRTFRDQINSLKHKISCESDPFLVSGMKAQIERYRQDLLILEQYAEDDQVVDNGNIYKVQSEVVPSLQGHLSKIRPVIRLLDRGIILTRINPSERDTSVLVKIRPGWEEIRSYLTPTGDHQRPFDVYVCTTVEHELTMEMWRLLDPQFELIASSQLHSRVMCLKANLCKSLQDIFHYRQCHPKMSLVIDNRVDVWDEKDQSRVHVVPTFSPYSTPQEEANAFPLPDVKNVASNVSQGFFRDFDRVFLPRIDEVLYEDEFTDLPSGPDVGDYLLSEDASISLVEENNDSKDINLSQYGGDGSNLALVPVSASSSGKGLPYAPENWPKKGDVWTWRVGQRVARSGHYLDRYLYPPEQYTTGRLVLSSRSSVEEFVKKEFPGADVTSFFDSFSWKIPCKGRGCIDYNYSECSTLRDLILGFLPVYIQ